MAFQSTLPAWGETYYNNYSALVGRISIHSPRMGRDRADTLGAGHDPHFNPLSPHGERPKLATFWGASRQFQSTLPAWGETISDGAYKHCEAISIHSPRMGRDVQDLRPRHVLLQISIHSPRMGRDCATAGKPRRRCYFNPLSPHGERLESSSKTHRVKYFNPLSPHGERRNGCGLQSQVP